MRNIFILLAMVVSTGAGNAQDSQKAEVAVVLSQAKFLGTWSSNCASGGVQELSIGPEGEVVSRTIDRSNGTTYPATKVVAVKLLPPTMIRLSLQGSPGSNITFVTYKVFGNRIQVFDLRNDKGTVITEQGRSVRLGSEEPTMGRCSGDVHDRVTLDQIRIPVPTQQAQAPVVQKKQKKATTTPSSAADASAQTVPDMINSFRNQVLRCWMVPQGASGTVTVRVQFDRDGSLAKEPRLISTPSDQFGAALGSQALAALKKCQPFKLAPSLYETWKDIIIDFAAPEARPESYVEKLERAEQERQRQLAVELAAKQKQRLEDIQAGLTRVRSELGTALETEEGRAYVLPLLQVYRQRELCNGVYEYVGGKVLGRSIDGNVGVILVELLAVAVRDSNTFEAGSGMARLCGYPAGRLQPGGILRMEVKGVFRKYDTGWRFERILE